ncbi:unnamed protein product [Phytomonas sp. EM1]|nr:unnamed protein product [Phytomonas sp. EM1]|eukprot:CCW65872.1 unnamed protein product [Phytomonas sp. isolate EM1]
MIPLENLSYQLHCSNSNAPLKILSVLEEGGVEKGDNQKEKRAGKALSKARKSFNITTTADKMALGEVTNATSDGANSFSFLEMEGSKVIVVEPMPFGSEVALVVRFRGVVQEGDVGAIYSPYSSRGSSFEQPISCSFPILTHFEVALARWAFPCPDHPQYRICWQLKTLQLPSIYHTVVGNTSLVVSSSGQGSCVQYRGAPCGPLPAYVFAFAAFTGARALKRVSGSLEILRVGVFLQQPPSNLQLDGNMSAMVTCEGGERNTDSLDLHVMATPEGGVEEVTLKRVMHVVQEAVRLLQHFFHSPLPLLQCDVVTVLLAPTMPYLSGMEHHCCVFLDEAIFATKRAGAAEKGGKDKHTAEIEQVELIVHEIVHHWMGNAVGLPFAVKEGICMVLESVFADIILYGKPKRRVMDFRREKRVL